MPRFEDTPDLFGNGAGVSTYGPFTCDKCKRDYNQDVESGREANCHGSPVTHTTFAGMEICEECFDSIEHEILNRMGDLLPWYARYLDRCEKNLKKRRDEMRTIKKGSGKS